MGIPASTPHMGVVRAVASTLAARLDFTFDRITDLHIALDEVGSRIMAGSDPAARRLRFTFGVRDGGIRVVARGDQPLGGEHGFLNPWAQIILESLTESIEIKDEEGVATVTFDVGNGTSQ